MNLIKNAEYSTIGGKDLYLPNGVALLSTGDLVIADGGNNRICRLNINSGESNSIGTMGCGRYQLKEPVGVFTSEEDHVFVADWHNHRLVIYDHNLDYISEIGHYGRVGKPTLSDKVKDIIYMLGSYAYKGAYIEDHSVENKIAFTDFSPSHLSRSLKYQITSKGVVSFFEDVYRREEIFAKPNGIAFVDSDIYITHKDTNSISKYSYNDIGSLRKVRDYCGILPNGRLCDLSHITSYDDEYFILCACENDQFYILNGDLNIDRVVDGRGARPFSCSMLSDRVLLILGTEKLLLYDLTKNEIFRVQDWEGTLHGVAYDRESSIIYLCNRGLNKIEEIQIMDIL